jgi:hypothetical protein
MSSPEGGSVDDNSYRYSRISFCFDFAGIPRGLNRSPIRADRGRLKRRVE